MRHIVTMIVDISPDRAEAIRSHMHAAKLEVTYFNGSRNETHVLRPRRLTVAREPLSSLADGTFVEVTRIVDENGDEEPVRMRGMVFGDGPLPLLDLDLTSGNVDPWRRVPLAAVLEWEVIK